MGFVICFLCTYTHYTLGISRFSSFLVKNQRCQKFQCKSPFDLNIIKVVFFFVFFPQDARDKHCVALLYGLETICSVILTNITILLPWFYGPQGQQNDMHMYEFVCGRQRGPSHFSLQTINLKYSNGQMTWNLEFSE